MSLKGSCDVEGSWVDFVDGVRLQSGSRSLGSRVKSSREVEGSNAL